ncbi:MAG: hypothetical protein WBZ33_16005 [Thermoactinomyces sp.]
MSDLVRVNIRVTPDVHQWFMDKSKKTGVSMSSLMFLALERHIQEQQVIPLLPEMVRQVEIIELMKANGMWDEEKNREWGLREGCSNGLDSERGE